MLLLASSGPTPPLPPWLSHLPFSKLGAHSLGLSAAPLGSWGLPKRSTPAVVPAVGSRGAEGQEGCSADVRSLKIELRMSSFIRGV